VTPGKDGSERDTMTAAKLGRVGVPEATGLAPAARPVVVATSRSPAPALRLGLAGVAVASAVVGLVLFDDADPALWTEGYWPVRELLPAAIAFSIGGALLLKYRKARWPASVLLICGLLAGLSLLFAGLWWDAMMVHGPLAEPLIRATDVTLGLFMGLSLTLRALLGRVEDIEIVGEAATTQEAIEVTEAARPDVVLMDLHLPGDGGEVATTTILASHPEVAVLVLTMHSDDTHLRHALNAGARGYLLKDAEPDAIIRAIVAVSQGQAIFDGASPEG
jgi:CheY-like chemotaxis protein